MKGSMKIETTEYQTLLEQNHLFFLTPSSQHTFYSYDRNEFLVLDISKSLIPDKFQISDTILNDQYLPLDKKWEAIRFLFLNELSTNESSNDRLNLLMKYAFEYLFPSTPIHISLNYLKQHYNEKIDIKTLAEMENFHPSYYTTWFKNTFGILPSKYIQHLRLEKAKELLKETNLSILEIAIGVGFNHASSLNKLFINTFKFTPKQYRKIHRNR